MTRRVVIDPEYRILLPLDMRNAQGIEPGREIEIELESGSLRIKPIRSIEELRGAFPGVSSDFRQERDTEWHN